MRPRVLLADDDAVRSMLQVALERDGFEVVAVLLSDLHMPHAGGACMRGLTPPRWARRRGAENRLFSE
jgi:hypothetical protein